MRNLDIKVRHITRVEGHGDVAVVVKDGRLKSARFRIPESPRFFEVMLQGRPYQSAAPISSRICGICAVAHTTASLKATEDAFGLTPSAQTLMLRRLIYCGEVIQSHILHIYFLAAPDLFGTGSVIQLAGTHAEVVKRALRLKKLGNDICAVVGGRHVHPVTMAVGGFTALPDEAALLGLRESLGQAVADLDETVELLRGFSLPEFARETEYVSLSDGEGYALYAGDIASSKGGVTPFRDYRGLIAERVVEGSTAKHAVTPNGRYMVGALARFNNGHGMLDERAAGAAGLLGLAAPCHNPYMITAAQLVETIHVADEAAGLIDGLLGRGVEPEDAPPVRPVEGRGVGVVEAPRGLLIHELEYGADGRVRSANCVIPTGQNIANIEADMQRLVPEVIDRPKEEIKRLLEMLVRAYDPCISCSTHAVKLIIK